MEYCSRLKTSPKCITNCGRSLKLQGVGKYCTRCGTIVRSLLKRKKYQGMSTKDLYALVHKIDDERQKKFKKVL